MESYGKYKESVAHNTARTCNIGSCNFFDSWFNSSFSYNTHTNFNNITGNKVCTVYKYPKILKIAISNLHG